MLHKMCDYGMEIAWSTRTKKEESEDFAAGSPTIDDLIISLIVSLH